MVLTPDSVPGLSLTLDYFDITVEDGIGSISAKTALDKCIETGQSSYCGLINRLPNGSLWLQGGYISQQLTNIGEESTSGFDVIFSYGLDTDWGPVSIEGVTTLLDSYDIVEFQAHLLFLVQETGVVHVVKTQCLSLWVNIKRLYQQTLILTLQLV